MATPRPGPRARSRLTAIGALLAATALVAPSSFFEGSWSAGDMDGTVYSVPWYAYTRVLIYRKDFAEAAGVTAPTTWDETVPFFEALQRGGAVHGYGADVGWDTYNGQTLDTSAQQEGWTDQHIATAVLPSGPDNESGQLAGGSWGVTAASANPQGAWKVVRAMAQQDTQVAQYAA